MRSRKKASRRVRHELGQDVPDSGQEHLAHSDNGFLVTTTSLDAAIAFSKFRMLSGMDERVGHLNQKRFQVRACTGNARGLNLCAALVIPWATASPRTQVLGCWKYGHVAADLRKDSNSRHTFACCESLTEVAISDGVASIGICAFSECQNLTRVIIPRSVTFIDRRAFSNCSKKLVLTVERGSYAEEYASKQKIPHIYPDAGASQDAQAPSPSPRKKSNR